MKLLLPNRAENMYTNNQQGLALLRFNHHYCMTVYEDRNFQIFHTEIGNYVYNKKTETVIQLSINSWTRIVLKIESTLNYPPAGRLVSIMSAGVITNQKLQYFRDFVMLNHGTVHINGQEFKEAFNSTGVTTITLVINKPL